MNKIKLFVLLIGSLIASDKLSAQWSNVDTTYLPEIRSVLFHPISDPLAIPMFALHGGGQLKLSFDDMRGGFMDLKYQIIHCNSDWSRSEMNFMEYASGFEEERLRNFEYSINTYESYTYYELLFPNEDLNVIISGNYLLHVYQDDDFNTPLLTRRFLVAESDLRIAPQMRITSNAGKYRSHQEMDVIVNFKNQRLVNPINEVTLTILQNNRWDNALQGLKAQSARAEDLMYNYIDKLVFPAGKPFRNFDVRSLQRRTVNVKSIEQFADGIDVHIIPDKDRSSINFINYADARGGFVIENQDRPVTATQSEYVLVHFTLAVPEMQSGDVYVCGRLTDWQLRAPFKMAYDEKSKSYKVSVMLKQGYYDYYYVHSEDGKTFDYTPLEGNWSETDNEYTLLAYWRPFGSRYDKLSAVSRIKASSISTSR
ncbi:MAG: DUF5103 domain-containing protein [Saprospiraceae bacterium]|nr:DUF5103 domain-containing protein [Saprospiraceae bacterium]